MNDELSTSTGAETTIAQDEWQKLADSLPNKDGHVQTTDPLFDTAGAFLPVTIQKPERVAAKDEKGVAVRVNFRLDVESIDTQGTKRAPGYLLRQRPYIIEGASDSADDQAAAERGRRDLARDMERLGLLPRLGSHSRGTLIASIGKLANIKAKIKLWTRDGKDRDEETGQVRKFQNFLLAPFEAPEGSNGPKTLTNV